MVKPCAAAKRSGLAARGQNPPGIRPAVHPGWTVAGFLSAGPGRVAPAAGLLGAALIGLVFVCASCAPRAVADSAAIGAIDAAAPGAEPDSGQVATTPAAVVVEEDDSVSEESADAVVVIGAVLPLSGSPSSREYARLFIEGLEVGALLARRSGVNVEVVVEDNLGTASGSARGVDALLDRGALAIIGPLDADNVRAAVRAAPRDLAFFSPTARQLPYGRPGVYSLAAGDPEAGRSLAQALWDLGYADVVILHPRSSRESVEMDAFKQTFVSLGGLVRRRIRYLSGTTTFEEDLTRAKSLEPSVLVVAAPPADLELLAPQIAFFGLDEMEVRIAGTAAWTDPLVIDGVARRHTDSVIALSTTPPGEVRQPPPEFVGAYEELFRRSFNSMVPAAGFDLLRMALDAYREGARHSREVMGALERLAPFEGVTGTFSFTTDGRLTQRFYPVRILGGTLHPLTADSTLIPASR